MGDWTRRRVRGSGMTAATKIFYILGRAQGAKPKDKEEEELKVELLISKKIDLCCVPAGRTGAAFYDTRKFLFQVIGIVIQDCSVGGYISECVVRQRD